MIDVVFDHSIEEAPTIHTFWFKVSGSIDYIPGQFTEITISHDNPDNRGIKRWFTLSSSPLESPLISITTKIIDKSSTFKHALLNLEKGTKLQFADPMGDFVLPRDSSRPLVFVAGGIGITPFHSMIKWLTAMEEARNITLLYAINNESEIIFQKDVSFFKLQTKIIASEPAADWKGETGRLNGQRVIDLAKPPTDSLIYISGPEPMVEALNKDLLALNVPKTQLVGDYFPGYTSI